MSAVAPRRMVHLDDQLLVSMAANQHYLVQFPILSSLAGVARKATGGCGRCGRRDTDRGQSLNNVKKAFAEMGPDKKRALLKLLNASSVRITFSNGAQTVVKTIEGPNV